jgi:hypothetical protein
MAVGRFHASAWLWALPFLEAVANASGRGAPGDPGMRESHPEQA